MSTKKEKKTKLEREESCSIDKLLEDAFDLKILVETKPNKTIDNETFDLIVNAVSKHYGISLPVALVGIFSVFQAGGASNNKKSNVKIKIADTSFESKVINLYINRLCKGITPRQIARHYCNQIQACASRYNITGNAYIYLQRFHPNLLLVEKKSELERYWCSDFQVDNPDCPEYIRFALKQRYNDKFRRVANNRIDIKQ